MNQRNTAETLSYLDNHSEELVSAVSAREAAAHPGLFERFGQVARRRCLDDNRFHLHYLSAAVIAGNPSLFSDYCGWASTVLESRGIQTSHLEDNLRNWKAVVIDAAPPHISDTIVGFLDLALRRLRDYSYQPPSFVTEDAVLQEYVGAVLALDSAAAMRIAETNVKDAQGAIDFFLNVLQPAQREIGRLWQTNSVTVAVEHYATGIAQNIVSRLSQELRPSRSRGTRFIGFCPENEHHCLGLQFVCDLARLDGWDSYFIGANMPLNAIRIFATKLQPDAIGVSVTTLLSLQNARSVITTLNEAAPHAVVIAGGYALSLMPDLWKTIGADSYAADAASAMATLGQIAGDRSAYLTNRTDPTSAR